MKKLRITVGQNVYEVVVEEIGAAAPAGGAGPARVAPAAAGMPQAAPVAPAAAAVGPGEVTSPLAGKVISIDVQVGAPVAENDRVATIEAMKMNTYLHAPRPGKVVEILAQPGASVEEGQLILRIE